MNAYVNEIDKIMGSPKFQIEFDNGSKDDGNKEFVDRLLILDEVWKKIEGIRSMFMNIFQPWLKKIKMVQ